MEAHKEFEPDPRNLATVRQFVTRVLDSWGMGSGAARDELLLLTNELATNAVQHSGGRFTVTLRASRRRVRVEVADHASAPPALMNALPTAERGRGLMLVDRLAADWGTEPVRDGKVVWLEVPVEGDAPLAFPEELRRLRRRG